MVLSLAFWCSEKANFLVGHRNIRYFTSRCQDEMMFFPHFQSIGMSTMYIALTVCEWCAFLLPRKLDRYSWEVNALQVGVGLSQGQGVKAPEELIELFVASLGSPDL